MKFYDSFLRADTNVTGQSRPSPFWKIAKMAFLTAAWNFIPNIFFLSAMKVLFCDFIQNVSKAKCSSRSSGLSQKVVISFEKNVYVITNKGRYMVKKCQEHVYVICESSLTSFQVLWKCHQVILSKKCLRLHPSAKTEDKSG